MKTKQKSTDKKRTRGANLCVDCASKEVQPFNGFKTWNCENCGKHALGRSSVVPTYCHSCSEKLNACEQCRVAFS